MTKNSAAAPGGKVDKKTAEAEFNRFADAWEIDRDVEGMTTEDRQSFEDQKRKVIKAICIGRATVGDTGDISYTFKEAIHGVDSVTLTMPRGEGYMEMDRYKEQQGVHKFMAVMGHMTGKPVKVFSGMGGIDLKFCMAVSTLFLAS
jgi:hypothetical protein